MRIVAKKKKVSMNMEDWVGKRKFCSQMTFDEIKGIFKRLRGVKSSGQKWRMSDHALDRVTEKGIRADYHDIVSVIYNSCIVEYKIDRNKITGLPEERVVLQSKAVVNRSYRLKVVFNITDNSIVTVWMNHLNDTHATLDWNLYDSEMPVFGIENL